MTSHVFHLSLSQCDARWQGGAMNEHRPPDDPLATIVSDVSDTPRGGAPTDTGDAYDSVRRIVRRSYTWSALAAVVGVGLILLPPVAETGLFAGRWLTIMGVTTLCCGVASLAQGLFLQTTADVAVAKGVMGWILIAEAAIALVVKLVGWTDLDLSGLIFVLAMLGAQCVHQARELRRAGQQDTTPRVEVRS